MTVEPSRRAPSSGMTTATELFPEAPRVLYEAAPLTEVICQLRYPSILRIERTPDDFQERVRREFPFFERAHNPQLPPEIVKLIGAEISPINYLFHTEDRLTTLSLTPDAIALSTKRYRLWEEFRDRLKGGLSALVEIYKPSFYSRVGLRYRNLIKRSGLGLDGRPWSDLLTPPILGELALAPFEHHVLELSHQVRASLPSGSGAVLLQHGIGDQPNGEKAYSLDFDFYTDSKTEVADAESILDQFNKRAGWAFRWCITEVLHEALRPKLISA
jgi:uncharacterized protein (TIGR04255 family)